MALGKTGAVGKSSDKGKACATPSRPTMQTPRMLLPSPSVDAAPAKEDEQLPYLPLACVTETLHLRIQSLLSSELSKDFAADFCTPVRFARFLQTLCRLARRLASVRRSKMSTYTKVLETRDTLEGLRRKHELALRETTVLLKQTIEKASLLSVRLVQEQDRCAQAEVTVQKASENDKLSKGQMAEVELCYGTELSRAKATVAAAFRQVSRLEKWDWDELTAFQQYPQPLVRTLALMQAIRSYLQHPDDNEHKELDPPRRDELTVCVAMGSHPPADLVSSPNLPLKVQVRAWAEAAAKPQGLELLKNWSCERTLPPWLAKTLISFVDDPECSLTALWDISRAASRMVQYLTARVDHHRVLRKMEDMRQRLGNLNLQVNQVAEELNAAKAEYQQSAETLKDLEQQHLRAVNLREQLLKDEGRLKGVVEQMDFLLDTMSSRWRDCEIFKKQLNDTEDSSDRWGLLLYQSVLCTYGTALGPGTRMAMLKEARTVLNEFEIKLPRDIDSEVHSAPFLPETFNWLASSFWPDKYMRDGAIALELCGSTATVVLDPFNLGLPWLRSIYKQRYPGNGATNEPRGPPDPSEALAAAVAKDLRRKAASKAGQNFDLDQYKHSFGNFDEVDGHKKEGLTILSGLEAPGVILDQLRQCMQEGQVLVLRLEELGPLRGLIGALLMAFSCGEDDTSVRADLASTNLHLRRYFVRKRAGTKSSTGGGRSHGRHAAADLALPWKRNQDLGLDVQLFNLRQQLLSALPLPHRRFRLIVLVPWCPWSASVWSASAQKRSEQLGWLPSSVWSTCDVVSLDPRPVHPARIFLPVFTQAVDRAGAKAREHLLERLGEQKTRLRIAEELLLDLLVTAEPNDQDCEELYLSVRSLSTIAAQLGAAVSVGSQEQEMDSQRTAPLLPFAGTLAVLLCATIDAELVRRGSPTEGMAEPEQPYIDRLNVEVEGIATQPEVLAALLRQQLLLKASVMEAVAVVIDLMLRAQSDRAGALLRVLFFLEAKVVSDKRVAAIWAAAVRSSLGGPETMSRTGSFMAHSTASRSRRFSDCSGVESRYSGENSEGAGTGSRPQSRNRIHSVANSDEEPPQDREKQEGQTKGKKDEGELEDAAEKEEDDGEEPEEDDFEEDDDLEEEPEQEDEDGEDSEKEREKKQKEAEKLGAFQVLSAGLFYGTRGTVGRRIQELLDLTNQTFPSEHPSRPLLKLLWVLPSDVPLFVLSRVVPALAAAVTTLGQEVQQVAALELKKGELLKEVEMALGSTRTWLFVDIADLIDFEELDEALHGMLSDALDPEEEEDVGWWGRTRMSAMVAGRLIGLDWSSRLVLHCSSETTRVPRHLLRRCLRIQNSLQFFGLLAEVRAPESYPNSEEGSEDVDVDELCVDSEAPEELGRGQGRIRTNSYGVVEALGHRRGHVEPGQGQLLAALSQVLLDSHPLFTAENTAVSHSWTASALQRMAEAVLASRRGVEDVQILEPSQLPRWLESRVVSRSRARTQERAVCDLLQSFAPGLMKQGDGEVHDLLSVISGKLFNLAQTVTNDITTLTAAAPMWLRLELHRTSQDIQDIREDLAMCCGALNGDAQWTPRLLAVYNAAARGRSIWANGRPLSMWLTSLSAHIAFLSGYVPDDSLETQTCRLGSVSNISLMLASYSQETRRFHIRLERKHLPASLQTLLPTNLPGMKGSMLRRGGSVLSTSSKHRPRHNRDSIMSVASDGGHKGTDGPSKSTEPALLVEGAHLVGAVWQAANIAEDDAEGGDCESELPPMLFRFCPGPPPETREWYRCPVMMVHTESYGKDFNGTPALHVYARTAMSPELCTLKGVRLLCFT